MLKVGQLFITGIEGTALTSEEQRFIEQEELGGVIFFKKNYQDPEQLAQLVNSIQKLRSDYPLFVAVDHEGGRVQRFQEGFTHFPPMLEIADRWTPKTCFEVHSVMAQELRACGVNLALSPVCDIFTNPVNTVIGDRAFARDPERVSKYISAAIRGWQTYGIFACAKHFPGHGDTTLDSHVDLPVIDHDLSFLRQREFLPFIKAIKSRVDFMMMGHLVVKSVNPHLPATLCAQFYDLLRNELKFQKLIISDDLEMDAILKHQSVEDASIKTLDAGCDLLLFRNFHTMVKVYEKVREAVRKKLVKKEDIERKLLKVAEFKKNSFPHYEPIYLPEVVKKIRMAEGKKLLEKFNV